jgi:hypothetical protein
MGRLITPYARPGRWVTDASQFLALLQDGGKRHFRLYSQVHTISTISFRLRNSGQALKPFAMQPLWGKKGQFKSSALYEAAHPDVVFTAPPGTKKVELDVMLSGHGGSADTRQQCAEFCDHQHEFSLNGGPAHTKSHPEAHDQRGCQKTVGDGTIPNQYGTWIYGRGGWCPGSRVPRWTADLTSDAQMDGANTLNYKIQVDGADYNPAATDASIDHSVYLVFYK